MFGRWRVAPLLVVLLLLAGCTIGRPGAADVRSGQQAAETGHSHPAGTGPHTHGEKAESGASSKAGPLLASSELLVGPNRFVFGLVSTATGAPISDVPEVDLQFFRLNADDTATKVGDAQPVYLGEGLPVGVYVTRATFDKAGRWGAIATIRPQGAAAYSVQMNFEVLADSPVPQVGEAAPPSRNLTSKDVKSLEEIDSGRPPNDMHDLTIEQAVRSGKPTLILFATPGYCETATCGPDLEVAKALQAKHGGDANFVHIETPTSPQAPQVQRPTVVEWGMRTEPWIFLVDAKGVVAERFEGGLTLAEVEPAFEKLLK